MALQECSTLWLLQHFPFVALKACDSDKYLAVEGDRVVREFRHGDSFLHCHTTSKELFHFTVVRELESHKFECTIEDASGQNLVLDPTTGTLVTRSFADTLGVGIPALYLWTVAMETVDAISLSSNGRFLSSNCQSLDIYDSMSCLFEPHLKTAMKSMKNGKYISASMMDSSIVANKLQANAWEMFLVQLSAKSRIICYESTVWTVTGNSRMVMSAGAEAGGSLFTIKFCPSRGAFVFQVDGFSVRVGGDGQLLADSPTDTTDSETAVDALFQLVPLPASGELRTSGDRVNTSQTQPHTTAGAVLPQVTPRLQCCAPLEKVTSVQEVLDAIGTENQGVILCEDLLMCDQLSDTLRLNGFASLAIHHAKSAAEQQWTLQQFESSAAQFLVISETFARKLLTRLPQPFVDALVFYNVPPTEEQILSLLPWTAGTCYFMVVATDEPEQLRAIEGTLRQLNGREDLNNELSLLSTILSNSENARKRTRVFGTPLPRDTGLPDEVAGIIAYIEEFGLANEKLLLLGTEVSFVASMRRRIDRGEALMLTPSGNDSTIAAALLQLYLKELPDPLLGSITDDLFSFRGRSKDEQVGWWRKAAAGLYQGQQVLLRRICELVEAIAGKASVHNLTASVLCVKFAPLMMGAAAQNAETAPIAVEALEALVTEHRRVFSSLSSAPPPSSVLHTHNMSSLGSDISVPGPPSQTEKKTLTGGSSGAEVANFFVPSAQANPSSNLLNFSAQPAPAYGDLVGRLPDAPTAAPPSAPQSQPLLALHQQISGLTPGQQQAMSGGGGGPGGGLLAPFQRPSSAPAQHTPLLQHQPPAAFHAGQQMAGMQQQQLGMQQLGMQQQQQMPSVPQQQPLLRQPQPQQAAGMLGANPLLPSPAGLAMPAVPAANLPTVPLGAIPNVPFPSTSGGSAPAGKEPWELDTSEVTLERKIGSGSFGEVWKGEWAGIDVAIKKISKAGISDKELKAFREEIEIMTKLRHPNILQFLGACLSPEFLLVTEYAENGSLYSLLQNRNVKISWAQAMKLVVDVAKGILYLHSRTPVIVHRDIKSLNILVTKDWKAIVADFGLTKIKAVGYLKTYCGSPAWTAPEVLRGVQYDEMADVYSFGIVLWEILTRSAPYSGMEPSVIIGKVAFNQPGMRPPIPPQATGPFVDLMRRCWADDPRQRPNFSEILRILKTL